MQNIEQIKAADPFYSVWVSASAGTGKTKVLTDRVLRLLLQNVSPSQILCLTFTKAATTEMLSRINNELKSWASISPILLEEKLNTLLGRQSTKNEKISAQNLFTTFQNSLEEIQIHTIHGFCNSILKLFPFEAGIKPGFILINDLQASYILKKISQEIQSNSINIETLWPITRITHDQIIEKLIAEIISQKTKFKYLINNIKNHDLYKTQLKEILNVNHNNSSEVLLKLFDRLSKYGTLEKTNDEASNIIIDNYNNIILYKHDDLFIAYQKLKIIFLTTTGTPRSRIISSKASKTFPALEKILREIQNIILSTNDEINSINIVEMSMCLFSLASIIIESYEIYKTSNAYIDYDDLISLTHKLLSNGTFNAWVNYKLDGFVSHILVDEAQDTSPEQWAIIDAITQEFYAGSGSSDIEKSLFIVGDEKQSIYSFQGGDLEVFLHMSQYITQRMQDSQKQYHKIDLLHGYRSSKAVSDFTSTLLDKLSQLSNTTFPISTKLECFRKNYGGRVEIWPLVTTNTSSKLFWPIFDKTNISESEYNLVSNITAYIQNILNSGQILHSTGLPIEPKDIMILVRRRSSFTNQLIYNMQQVGIPVDGIDRISLGDNLTIQDIISLAKFVLQPLDDLNLACLLKSPFIGLSENELQEVISNRNDYIFHTIQNDIKLLLQQFCTIHKANNAYDFLTTILDVYGYREKLLRINSHSDSDVIDTMLNLVLDFTQNVSSSLQEFIFWFNQNTPEVKREFGDSNKIKIMTVHASKGLESGIVILADTTTIPQSQSKFLWDTNGLAYFSASSQDSNDYIKTLKQEEKKAEYNEYLRLLYVAVTRAADILVITGNTSDNIDDNSWYHILLDTIKTVEHKKIQYPFYEQDILIYEPEILSEEQIANKKIIFPIKQLKLEKLTLKPKAIEEVTIAENKNYDAIFTPVQFNQIGYAVLYGKIFHKVLEDVILTHEISTAYNHNMLSLLPLVQQRFITHQIEKLLQLEYFQKLLQMEIQTEVSIGRKYKNTLRVGRVDLLAMSDTKLIIIDYKTDKNIPSNRQTINTQYIEQLEFYKSTLQQIHPNHVIDAKILWLENLTFMTI